MILGVSFDDPAANKAFAEKFNFGFQLLSDTNREAGLAYGACDAPTDTYARRVGVVIGPDGRVRGYWPKASSKTFPEDALQAVG